MDSAQMVVMFAGLCALGALVPGVLAIEMICSPEMKDKSCDALVMLRVKSKEEPSIADIGGLFGLDSYHAILGANSWSPTVSGNTRIRQGSTVIVPVKCACSSSSASNATLGMYRPVYTVAAGDFLSTIAMTYFGGLVTYQEIASFNNISDPNKIYISQKVVLPIPCSCSSPKYAHDVIVLTYVVDAAETLQYVASEYGSSVKDIVELNGNLPGLVKGQVIGVPLKACLSNISKNSGESKLLVANGSYAFTAERCVQCSCGPQDLKMYCTPGPMSDSCSGMLCKNSALTIGNLTTVQISGACNVTECLYNGYSNKTVLTVLDNHIERQCPAKHVLPTFTNPVTSAVAPSPMPISPTASNTPASPPTGNPTASTPKQQVNNGSAEAPTVVSPPPSSASLSSCISFLPYCLLLAGYLLLI